jgi:Tfp pilus assembly protein PilP
MAYPDDPRKKSRAAKAAAKRTMAATVTIRIPNKNWERVAPHYKKVLAKQHSTITDSFRPKVTNFITRPTLELPDDEPEIETIEEEVPRGPLEQHPIEDYSLMLIMSGTAEPKAVVLDGKGSAYVVQRGTRVGDKGGMVASITQYMVIVTEPNSDQPTKMLIKPPYLDLVSQVGFDIDAKSAEKAFQFSGAKAPSVKP